jgi:hypothetical protein
MEELNNTLKMVRKIKADMAKGMNRQELYHKYLDFATTKPKSFNHTVDGNFDEEVFNQIKDTYSESHESATENKDIEGATSVGNLLADKFLFSQITETPDEEKLKKMKEDLFKNI